jgi:hypothetical protein
MSGAAERRFLCSLINNARKFWGAVFLGGREKLIGGGQTDV